MSSFLRKTRGLTNSLVINEDLKKKIRTCSRECLSIQRHHRRFWSWKCTPLSVLPWVSLGFAPRCSWWHRFGKTKLLNSWLRHVLTSVDASSSSKKKMNSSSKIKKKKIFVGVVQIHAARQTRMKTSSLSRCSQKSEYLRLCCVWERACVCVNSNEEIFFLFSVFSSRMQPKRHEEPQKNICVPLCQSATSRYFWLARKKKKKKTTRWIWSRQRQKSQTTLSFIYRSTEKDDTNGQIRFRVVMVRPVLLLSRWPPMLCARVKRGKRCSCLQSKCTRVIFFFLVIESRETNTQRNQREGKTTTSLSQTIFRLRCPCVRLEKCTFASVLVRLKKKEERNNNEKTPTPKKKTKRCSSVRESRQKQRRWWLIGGFYVLVVLVLFLYLLYLHHHRRRLVRFPRIRNS